jgi:hypothetical protein
MAFLLDAFYRGGNISKVCRILISSSDHFFLPKYHQILKSMKFTFMKIGKRITTSNCTSLSFNGIFSILLTVASYVLLFNKGGNNSSKVKGKFCRSGFSVKEVLLIFHLYFGLLD